jgi:hypothetical protein
MRWLIHDPQQSEATVMWGQPPSAVRPGKARRGFPGRPRRGRGDMASPRRTAEGDIHCRSRRFKGSLPHGGSANAKRDVTP